MTRILIIILTVLAFTYCSRHERVKYDKDITLKDNITLRHGIGIDNIYFNYTNPDELTNYRKNKFTKKTGNWFMYRINNLPDKYYYADFFNTDTSLTFKFTSDFFEKDSDSANVDIALSEIWISSYGSKFDNGITIGQSSLLDVMNKFKIDSTGLFLTYSNNGTTRFFFNDKGILSKVIMYGRPKLSIK